MKVVDIKARLVRQATIFETGGIRPTHDLLESWIGFVGWSLPAEGCPRGFQPLATLFLKELPYVPTSLQQIELLTLFMNEEIFDHLIEDDLSRFFEIRAYTSLEGLVQQNWQHDRIRAFPLIPKMVDNDYPTWDGGGIPSDVEDEILRLEHEEDIEYFDDIVEEIYAVHKIGGYPAFCQSGRDYGEEFPFVLQIASDEKAYFNIVDNGNFYFFFNRELNEWRVDCDFY
ncbi:hypothetical protein ABE61_00420 [Lysinibacillus sphaericus]|uniref:DUF1963 domain-containing protein n=1 Tax=Lysinibacillus sphaericus TaxID=1421 RepID=UPI0018CEACFE|nr:DUF1963 domain-containing protein [Lysinibacillus sphaericus]MBG9452590.1 hypothetical protein [Lysinibacillus sphaericus]MBG9476970.1 hypothetical protein [Lysinibacillus sphaericus]MBG9592739.1 hypothetical protein [Lysinibacillus sphaericus]